MEEKKEKVLIVEDETKLARFVELELKHEGYEVFVANDGRSGIESYFEHEPDIILLDLMLPQLNGIEVCRRIRKESNVPIIMLTAKGEVMDKVLGLDNGADDYIAKPFAIEEVLARIRVALRHTTINNKENDENILTLKNLTVDLQKHSVKYKNEEIELTKREFELLVYLLQNKNIVITRNQILNQVWGYDYIGETNVVDVYIDIRVTLRDNKFFADTMKNPDEFPSLEPPMDSSGQRKKNNPDNRFHTKTISNQPYMFTHREVTYNNKVYDIGIFRTYSHEYSIINIIAFFISYYAGKYIANKILKPIRNITETAENISINDLQQRIEVPETDDEIKKLIVTFNDMISRLDQSFEKQKQFVSDASHELRTPISVIQGYVNLIDRWGKSDTEVLEESISSIKYETEHMANLIKQLLFLARTDNKTQTAQLKPENISIIAEDVVREATVMDSKITIKFTGDNSVIANIDEHLIKQLMWIFVDNAIKYSADKPIIINVNTGYENEKPFFTVADKGIGMEQENINHIFDRFYRADQSRNKEIDGNGLGLSIAKWIIEQHNGHIDVVSAIGKGSCFKITFPKL